MAKKGKGRETNQSTSQQSPRRGESSTGQTSSGKKPSRQKTKQKEKSESRKKWRCVVCNAKKNYPSPLCLRQENCGCEEGHYLPLYIAEEKIHNLVCYYCFDSYNDGTGRELRTMTDREEAQLVTQWRETYLESARFSDLNRRWLTALEGKWFKGSTPDPKGDLVVPRQWRFGSSDDDTDDEGGGGKASSSGKKPDMRVFSQNTPDPLGHPPDQYDRYYPTSSGSSSVGINPDQPLPEHLEENTWQGRADQRYNQPSWKAAGSGDGSGGAGNKGGGSTSSGQSGGSGGKKRS